MSHVIRRTFTQSWSPYAGAVVILLLCLGLMQQGLFWGVFGGLKLWGDHLNSLIGLAPYLGIDSELPDPFLHRISLMNIVLFLGAMSAALISRQFRINRPPPLEYVWGAGGGILMGLGATLAGGCTVGGFFTPAMFSSPAGWTMWAGLLIGVVIGLKLLYWTFEHVTWGMQAPVSGPRSPMLRYFPVIGLLVMAAVVAWSVSWSLSTDKLESNRGFLLAAVFLIGFAMHRSRFCFSRALREPFMTAEGGMSKAVMLLLFLGIPAGAVLLQQGKGADMGAAFGSGASGTVFGARGSGSFFTRATAVLAAAFFINCLLIASPLVRKAAAALDTGRGADGFQVGQHVAAAAQPGQLLGQHGAPVRHLRVGRRVLAGDVEHRPAADRGSQAQARYVLAQLQPFLHRPVGGDGPGGVQ